MVVLEERLEKHRFLKGLSADNIRLLAEDAIPMAFKPGDILFRQGKTARHLFLIENGIVAVGFLKKGKECPVTVANLGKGENLGWSWAFPPYEWNFDAQAKTQVETLALESKPVLAKMERYPLLGYELMKHLACSLAKSLEATGHQWIQIHHKLPEIDRLIFPEPMIQP